MALTRLTIAALALTLMAGAAHGRVATPRAPIATAPDTRGYARLLETYVSSVSIDKIPVATTVDYARLRAETQTGARNPTLDAIRRALLAVPPSRMNAADRLAWAINTYNFLVIEAVTRGLVSSTGDTIATVRELGSKARPFFNRPIVTVEGHAYSLDAFEQHFLFADFDHKHGAPPAELDPRVHFALVCAARGCPPLLGRPYVGAELQTQLEDAVRRTLHSPRHLALDASTSTLAASAIFDWYETDFGGKEQAFATLKMYAPPRTRAEIERLHVSGIARTIPWDWTLNRTAGDASPAP